MITGGMLDELLDDDLRKTRGLIDDILQKRAEDRKAKAIEEARATLAAAGLSFKDLKTKGKSRSSKTHSYHSGHTYQHPANKTLLWNGKGKKPHWLVTLETEGKEPVELATAS